MCVSGAVLSKQKSYKDKLWIFHYKTMVEVSTEGDIVRIQKQVVNRCKNQIKISDEYVIKKMLIEGSTACVYAYKDKRWIRH